MPGTQKRIKKTLLSCPYGVVLNHLFQSKLDYRPKIQSLECLGFSVNGSKTPRELLPGSVIEPILLNGGCFMSVIPRIVCLCVFILEIMYVGIIYPSNMSSWTYFTLILQSNNCSFIAHRVSCTEKGKFSMCKCSTRMEMIYCPAPQYWHMDVVKVLVSECLGRVRMTYLFVTVPAMTYNVWGQCQVVVSNRATSRPSRVYARTQTHTPLIPSLCPIDSGVIAAWTGFLLLCKIKKCCHNHP